MTTLDVARATAPLPVGDDLDTAAPGRSRSWPREGVWFLGAPLVASIAVQAGVPVDFALFGLVLAGVVLFHNRTLTVALVGLITIVAYEIVFGRFDSTGFAGLASHLDHEWVTLANLLGLLLGFALLANHFEASNLPAALPRVLPDGARGAFLLLVVVFVLSSFLDNIAAAMIGGAMARVVFRGRVHIGYLAAIVAAANGGGSGSVVGDTTTTMIWIHGVNPVNVLHAYGAAVVALVVSGTIAARQQQAHAPMIGHWPAGMRVDWIRIGIVAFILLVTLGANVTANLRFPEWLDRFPVIGIAVWVAIIVSAPLRQPDWRLLSGALKVSAFLLSLVVCASLMPIENLPVASWTSTMGLGFVSSVFDNIPLTALALEQGGYDWGVLAFAVGYGGSMLWFGSSAGIALASVHPEARSVARWLAHGWHVALAYVIGFFALLTTYGWQPHAP